MDLAYLWFWIVGFLFVGYFVLDGFDFGVGMSLPFLGKDDVDRRVLINTIGPVWDLNETWVIVAGASLFAAFPEWYATLFSGFYLALLLILLATITHVSLRSHTGPIVLMSTRRSVSSLPRNGSDMPTPKSNPSSTK